MEEGTPPAARPSGWRIAFEVLAAAVAGAAAFLWPASLGLAGRNRGSLLQTAAEGVGFPALASLFVVGFLLGLRGVLKPIPGGLSTMAAMPLLAIYDLTRDPTSHNLLPFEFAFYALYGMVAAGGAALARVAVRRVRGEPQAPPLSERGPEDDAR